MNEAFIVACKRKNRRRQLNQRTLWAGVQVEPSADIDDQVILLRLGLLFAK